LSLPELVGLFAFFFVVWGVPLAVFPRLWMREYRKAKSADVQELEQKARALRLERAYLDLGKRQAEEAQRP
jgi:hypothetical protein